MSVHIANVDNITLVETSAADKSSNSQKSKKYKNVNDFLKAHLLKKEDNNPPNITNTRIPNQEDGVFGGSFSILDEEYPEFIKLVWQNIFVNGKTEHLTEKQLDKGPILVDLDLRFDFSQKTRIYTEDHLLDLMDGYLAEFKKMYQFDEDTAFPIFFLEKETVNCVEEKNITKDGIHIIFGIQADRTTQTILRKRMVEYTKNCWTDLPITNTWEDVFDKGISEGGTNWQMIGSCKPKHIAYKLTKIYNITFDPEDEQFRIKKESLANFDMSKNIAKLSARYKEHYDPFMRTDFIEEHRANKGENVNIKRSIAQQQQIGSSDGGCDIQDILSVRNREELEVCLQKFLDSIDKDEYELKETYDYTMTLPVSYYGSGSYDKWTRVGWSLKNINPRLFIVWVVFSAQSPTFDYSSIRDMWDRWTKVNIKKMDGLTKRSIMYWSNKDSPEKFKLVRENSVDYYIDQTLDPLLANYSTSNKKPGGCGDFEIATVLYHLMKDRFVCVSVKSNIWYEFTQNRWVENDSGTSLRQSISVELKKLYHMKACTLNDTITEFPEGDERVPMLQKRVVKIMDVVKRLGQTADKKNIMIEAKELLYDNNFFKLLDVNPYLLCCKNGVFDFKEGIFRPGKPDDYISKCTGIEYHAKISPIIRNEIEIFMRQLFPVDQLYEYMWDHLSSTLIGRSSNQTFNNYVGIGSNGKSVLVTLMSMVLGQYKEDLPLSAMTSSKRVSVGGLAPEIVALKGTRYVVLEEPSKGEKLNDGILKSLTSGFDTIQARAPYMLEPVKFLPQFKLVVATNTFMEINNQDHGTWRRIRVVDFLSLFTNTPVEGDPDKPYQYKTDVTIIDKFEDWKETFLSMLVQRVIKTNGIVNDCEMVLASSKSYRDKQDVIAQFITEKIFRWQGNKKITKTEINFEFINWHTQTYGSKGPKAKELHEYMEKQFGKYSNGWSNIRIKHDNENDDEEEDVVDEGDVTDPLHSRR